MHEAVEIESFENSAAIDVISRPLCLLCREQGVGLYAGMRDWLFGVPGDWSLRYCRTCAIAWLDPQPVPSDVGKLYARYYTHIDRIPVTRLDHLRQAVLECTLANLGYASARPKQILPRLLSRVRPFARAAALEVLGLPASEIGELLDVGCGNGEFIARMRSLGWRVTGVDPDLKAVSYATRQGLEVRGGRISDLPDNVYYDIITLNHVIEHAFDPVDLLRECRKRLRAGTGRIILTTPNIRSLGHRWFRRYWRGLEVPRHLILFTLPALRECAKQAGLAVQNIGTETRLSRMIYNPSVYAQQGHQDIGYRLNFRVRTKIASYLFQAVEEIAMYLHKGVGEEIICVCSAARNEL